MHIGREGTSARPAHPMTLTRYRLLLVAAALGVLVGAALHASASARPGLLPLAFVVVVPLLARLVARHLQGAYAVLGGLVLSAAVAQHPETGTGLFLVWSAVMLGVHTLFLRTLRSALTATAIAVLAGAALLVAERHVDLHVRPLGQMLVGLTLYLLVLWALGLPLDLLSRGWANRAAVARRHLAWIAVGVVYVGVITGLLAVLAHSNDRGWATSGSAALLFVVGLACWQAMRIATLRRISRALTEAAVTTPWPTDEILPTLVRLVGTHVRASRVAVVDQPTEGSLWAPLDTDRYLVVERRPGDLGFTRYDAHLIAGLASMARASLEYADRERRLELQALTDHLTGLWSYRRWLELLVEAAADRTAEHPHRAGDGHPSQLGVVFLDCDGFKQINSRYGHLQADRILAIIGERLRLLGESVGWCFARFGGDEFTGWLVEDAAPETFTKRCQELAAVVAEPIQLDQHRITVTASIGRALADASSEAAGETVDELVASAEIDMRRRKLHKPGAVLTQHTDRDVVRRMLAAGEIAVAYQPIVTLADRQVWGCEALLRGHTGTLGLIPPPVLIESAAEARLLDAVTREVMEQAIAFTQQASAACGRPLTLTLNLEIEQFHAGSGLLERLVDRVEASGVPVVLELSERQPMPWTPERDQLADELAAHRIGVGLDDLGAGESRLTLVGSRAWDLVKLDRGLLLEDHRGHGPVVLRHLMGILGDYALGGTVAEGIETPEQERIARELGIRYGQGNGYGAAASGPDLLRLLRGGALPYPRG